MTAPTRDEVIRMAREAGAPDPMVFLAAYDRLVAAAYARGVADARDSAPADHIPGAGKMVQAAPPHCEAGPEFCPQCHAESKPTYGSEEVRKLRETIASLAQIVNTLQIELVAAQPRPFVELSDMEWVNIVNLNNAWDEYPPHEVAHQVATLVADALRAKNEVKPLAVTGCSYCLNKTAYKLTPTCTECGHDMLTADQLEAAMAMIDKRAAQALGEEGGAA